MGVFGTHYDMNTFPLAEGSFYPRFLCLRKNNNNKEESSLVLVMELCQKNLGRQAEVNPDKNCACEGVVHLQNKAVNCASRIKKGCVGERSVWGLLQIFLQAVVQLLWTAEKNVYITETWSIWKHALHTSAFEFFFLSNVIQQPSTLYCAFSPCKTRACTSAHMLMRH